MKNRLIAIAGGRIMGEVRYEGGRLDFHSLVSGLESNGIKL